MTLDLYLATHLDQRVSFFTVSPGDVRCSIQKAPGDCYFGAGETSSLAFQDALATLDAYTLKDN